MLTKIELMKEIPRGFVKMKLKLTLIPESADRIINDVLKMMVRDYYIFYHRKKPFDDPDYKLDEIEFYCRPQDETQIAYQIGIYAQTVNEHYTKEKIELASHRLPDDFPECISLSDEILIK